MRPYGEEPPHTRFQVSQESLTVEQRRALSSLLSTPLHFSLTAGLQRTPQTILVSQQDLLRTPNGFGAKSVMFNEANEPVWIIGFDSISILLLFLSVSSMPSSRKWKIDWRNAIRLLFPVLCGRKSGGHDRWRRKLWRTGPHLWNASRSYRQRHLFIILIQCRFHPLPSSRLFVVVITCAMLYPSIMLCYLVLFGCIGSIAGAINWLWLWLIGYVR